MVLKPPRLQPISRENYPATASTKKLGPVPKRPPRPRRRAPSARAPPRSRHNGPPPPGQATPGPARVPSSRDRASSAARNLPYVRRGRFGGSCEVPTGSSPCPAEARVGMSGAAVVVRRARAVGREPSHGATARTSAGQCRLRTIHARAGAGAVSEVLRGFAQSAHREAAFFAHRVISVRRSGRQL